MILPSGECLAKIIDVECDSPAYEAGFEPGCAISHVDGNVIHDMIDWRWYSSDDQIEVGYIDLDGESGCVILEREPGQEWGFSFDGAVFDGVRTCKNSCTFCFMRQLPKGMRPSLILRDDDYRLSFLEGTFATFTNVRESDIERIIEQRISPLRVSLHAIDAAVRRRLIGKHEHQGIAALNRLMEAGIDFDAQIVLVNGENDGEVLDETLEWAYAHPHIKNVGIVPLGFTSHQSLFRKSFDDSQDALSVIEQIRPIQKRAIDERGYPWVFAADEFYCNAYGKDVASHIPDAGFYGDFSMYEDGIGIVRSGIDSWDLAKKKGLAAKLAKALEDVDAHVSFICGEAMRGYAQGLLRGSELDGIFDFVFAKNNFFGGNVNVTGLLCGCDIVNAVKGKVAIRATFGDDDQRHEIIVIPDVIFNDDGVTLDDWTFDDIRGHISKETGASVIVCASNPLDYIGQISNFASGLDSHI